MKGLNPVLAGGLVLLSCLGCRALFSQAAPANGDRTISGTVLNAKTGLPLEGATVSLGNPKAHKGPEQTQTNREGRFSFSQLADGKYTLRATRRGYINAGFEEHPGGFFTSVVTGEGLVTTGLKLMLEPQSVLFGTVTDDSGDPVPQARISLYRLDPSGTGKMIHASGASCDGAGNYEIARLAPGGYYLSLSATPWYATHPERRDSQGHASEQTRRSPLDVAYAVTYYPDTTDAGSAEPIVLAGGERLRVNLTLHPVPAVHVSLQVPTPGPGQPMMFPQLRQDVFGSTEYLSVAPSYIIQNDGPGAGTYTVDIAGVAPGRYELDLRNGRGEQNRSMSLDATSDRMNVDISQMQSLVDVTGKIEAAGESGLPNGLNLSLAPQQGSDRYGARVEADGSFHIEQVRPGTYEVQASGAGSAQSLSHLTATGGSVTGRILKVGGEPVTLTARVAEITASISGFVMLGDKPVSGVLVVLAPAGVSAAQETCRGYQSDSDGSFEFDHVPAGQYTVAAIQDGFALEWAHAEALARYLAKGVAVTVPPHSKEIALKEPVAAQAR